MPAVSLLFAFLLLKEEAGKKNQKLLLILLAARPRTSAPILTLRVLRLDGCLRPKRDGLIYIVLGGKLNLECVPDG